MHTIKSDVFTVPALLETTVKSFEPFSNTAAMRFSGIPQRPKPPTNNLAPSGMSFTASAALSNIFDFFDVDVVDRLHTRTCKPQKKTKLFTCRVINYYVLFSNECDKGI